MFSIPTAYPEGEDGPAITIISGESHGATSPVRPIGGCWYFDIKFKKAGQSIFQPIREFVALTLDARYLTPVISERMDRVYILYAAPSRR